jgi:PAS domain S-box-containing protein
MIQVESGDEDDIALIGTEPGARPIENLAARTLRRRRRVIVAIILGFVLLAGACAIAAMLAWRDAVVSNQLLDMRDGGRSVTLAPQALLTAESSARGYLLTHDARYVALYDSAASDFRSQTAQLRDHVGDRSDDRMLADEIQRLGDARLVEMDASMALAKAGRFADAIANARQDVDRIEMDQLRRDVAALTHDTTDAVTRTEATETWTSTLLLGTIVVALLCVGALALLLLGEARRRIGQLDARQAGLRRLADTLERLVARRTRALSEANQRFDTALSASGVTVMTQDRDLVFTWISHATFGLTAREVIGRPESEVTPEPALNQIAQMKRGVIETGDPARADLRAVRNSDELWLDVTVHPLRDEEGGITGVITGAIDITRYKEQEARIRLLMRELTHRSKNLLAVAQAIMRQTAANSTSIEDFETRFSARLNSLAGSHDLLVQEDWRGASMRELVRSQLGHYIELVGAQIELEGEPMRIQPDAAQHIAMAMHELATNAAKFGALSVPGGKVHISWHQQSGPDGETLCHISWVESGGPPVERPSRRGFGRVVSERTVARAVQGDVTVDYASSGLRWTLVFPAEFLATQ